MDANKEIIEFYDTESGQYSEKRYDGKTETYVQYFFKRRKQIVLGMMGRLVRGKTGLSLLDIACADGVITREMDSRFPGSFRQLVGVDISPKMIETARSISKGNERLSFFMKDECPVNKFDIALGLGYLSAKNLEEEMAFLLGRLVDGGSYICTLSSRYSIHTRLKLQDKPYLDHYEGYDWYLGVICRYFDIIEEIPYGLFVPKLWSLPFIGRALQPIFDAIFRKVLSEYFHEKVYLLKRKESLVVS